jgi:hypothetical protein
VPREAAATHSLGSLRGEAPPLPASVALSWSPDALHLAFEVASEPPLVVHASPAWANDCVEAFLSFPEAPWHYLELVLDAAGGTYAARVENPDGSRATWRLAPQEPPPGVLLVAEGGGEPKTRRRWRGRITVPWDVLERSPGPGLSIRANAFRIARGGTTRFLALSPTFRVSPPDFHVPDRFAELVLES